MRLFQLRRMVDVSGVSGVGVVAQGIIFDNGKCAMAWLTKHTSVAVYDNIEQVIAIHGHDGKTKIVQVANVEFEGAGTLGNYLDNRMLDHCEGVTGCAYSSPDVNKPNVQYIIDQREKILDLFREVELK